MTKLHTLKNGVRVLLTPDINASTAAVIVGVGVGSVNEKTTQHGLAHFFEHMCFKGTKKYSTPIELLSQMDMSGLQANAYTGTEYTAYHLSGSCEKLDEMIDLTADVFLNSLFPAEELEKEKGVILSEISMYEDDPSSKCVESVEQSLFYNTKAEHPILGTPKDVSRYSQEDFLNFFNTHYIAENTVISVAGNFNSEYVLSKLEGIYKDTPRGVFTELESIHPSGPKIQHKSVARSDLEQTHIAIGGYAPSKKSESRYVTYVLSILLGGSMSSRLFIAVREELGVCYSIRTFVDMNSYLSTFFIYLGTNEKQVNDAMKGIGVELQKIKNKIVSKEELQKAKNILLGMSALRQESKHKLGSVVMHELIQAGKVFDIEEYKKGIENVSAEDIMNLAKDIFVPEKISVCYVGNKDIQKEVTDLFLKTF